MRLGLFIDYDNLLEPHRRAGLLDIATRALHQIPPGLFADRGTCEMRVYGGWFERSDLTPLAQQVISELQRDFPTVVRVPRDNARVSQIHVAAELAFALLEDPARNLFNTYRKKGRPSNLRVQSPATVGCTNSACALPTARKLLKTGECPVLGCTVKVDDLVYRHEQKLVDTMLTCDLLYSSHLGYDCTLVISGDDDFLPPLRSLVVRGAFVIRFHTKPNGPRSTFNVGTHYLQELDL